MIDTLTAQNAQDFQRRYQTTIGFLLHNDKKTMVRLDKVTANACTFSDKDGTKYTANANTDVAFEFLPVKRGWYNGTERAFYLERRPERQWHRGICEGNTSIYFSNAARHLNQDSCKIEVLEDIFENNISQTEAINKWKKGERNSVALSLNFCFSNKSLLFWRAVVGEAWVDKEGATNIRVTTPLIAQEVQDLIKRNNLDVKLEVKA